MIDTSCKYFIEPIPFHRGDCFHSLMDKGRCTCFKSKRSSSIKKCSMIHIPEYDLQDGDKPEYCYNVESCPCLKFEE